MDNHKKIKLQYKSQEYFLSKGGRGVKPSQQSVPAQNILPSFTTTTTHFSSSLSP